MHNHIIKIYLNSLQMEFCFINTCCYDLAFWVCLIKKIMYQKVHYNIKLIMFAYVCNSVASGYLDIGKSGAKVFLAGNINARRRVSLYK